ncbi:MAG: hypothetical protein WCA06_02440, partial [Terrimicrobiaceae bacterium]
MFTGKKGKAFANQSEVSKGLAAKLLLMTPQALEEPAAAVPSGRAARYIQWFNEIGIDDVPLVGGKNASLGEMYRNLASAGVKVPNG